MQKVRLRCSEPELAELGRRKKEKNGELCVVSGFIVKEF